MKKGIVKSLVPLLSLALCAELSFAADSLSASAAASLLKKTDTNTAFMGTDFSANYTLVQDKPGQGKDTTTAVMYRRDDADSYTILITVIFPVFSNCDVNKINMICNSYISSDIFC